MPNNMMESFSNRPLPANHPLQRFLEFENSSELLNFKTVSGLPVWPLMRLNVLFACRDEFFGVAFKNIAGRSDLRGVGQRLKRSFLSLPDILSPWPSLPIIYMSTREPAFINGRFYDIFDQPTAELRPDQTLYVSLGGMKHTIFQALCSARSLEAPTNVRAACGLFFKSLSTRRLAANFTEFLIQRLKKFNFTALASQPGRLYALIIRHLGINLSLISYFQRFFARQKPKLLFVNNAVGGGRAAWWVFAAHQAGIETFEIQHGTVSEANLNLNQPKAFFQDENFQACQPKNFLAHSHFWASFIHAPLRVHVLGAPWFNLNRRRMIDTERQADRIIFSFGDDGTMLLEEVKTVSRAFPGRVTVRPHPLFRESFTRHIQPQLGNIQIDLSGGNDSMFSAGVVVSDFSTTAFEAAALGARTFIKNNKIVATFMANMPLEKFSEPDELVVKINDPSAGLVEQGLSASFFTGNWEENYNRLVESRLL